MHYSSTTLYSRSNGRQILRAVIEKPLAFDRAKPSLRSAFRRSKKLETNYAARLRRIAKHIADIIREFPEGTIEAAVLVQAAMERYAIALQPWAEAVADRMVAEAAQRDEVTWKKAAGQIGRSLKQEIETAPTGVAMRRLMEEQVTLITSLPREAGARVHKMTMEGISQGQRASAIVDRILETGDVTRSRAELIARTETARASSVLTQVRAQHIGCTHYRWRTTGDSDVRPSHKRLNGKVFAWNDPPECDPGHRAHAGQIWNCRCWCEPVLPE